MGYKSVIDGLFQVGEDGVFELQVGLTRAAVELEDLIVDGDHVEVHVSADAKGRFVGPGALVLASGEGARFSYDAGDEAYVRFEAESDAGRVFLQPLWKT